MARPGGGRALAMWGPREPSCIDSFAQKITYIPEKIILNHRGILTFVDIDFL